jgi:maltose O-acetyltransferase
MELIFNLQKLFLETLADLEFKLSSGVPNNRQKWRYRHLKHMKVIFGEKFHMGQDIHIRNRGNLNLGNRCGIGSFAKIWNYAPINIGEDFLAAAGLTLNSATHDPVTLQPQGREINIGSRVWCGINVTIVAGVNIGDDVVIGAGSVVVKDIPSMCVVGGVPAKKIRELDRTDIKIWGIFQ